jgi:hypothetical protein
MSFALRCLLYRTFNIIAHPRDAARQAGGDSVRAIVAGLPLCIVRPAGPASGLREPQTDERDVRCDQA